MNALRFIIGSVSVIAAALTLLHDQRWAFLSLFVGLNMIQFSFTDRCPLRWLLRQVKKSVK